MTIENWTVLAILVVSLALFILEKPRVDVVALMVLVACVATGLVAPENAFQGFASPAVVTVWAVFILSGGLEKTGIADAIGRMMQRAAGDSPNRLLVVMMFIAGILSGLINNIGTVAILLPAVMSVCRRINVAPSKMLIPLAVASLLGGNITLIGTPPNLIAVDLMASYGVEPFNFFEFAPTGLVALGVGLLYMLLVGKHLLPSREAIGDEVADPYHLRGYLVEAMVDEDSLLLGKHINQVRFGLENDVAIVYVRRGDIFMQQSSDRVIRPNDIILFEGTMEHILRVCTQLGLQIRPGLSENDLDQELQGDGTIVELTLSPRSGFRRKTLRELGFRARFGVTILAVRHEGESVATSLVDVPLRFGDVLLAQGEPTNIERLKENPHLIVLDNATQPKRGVNSGRAPYAILVMLATILSMFFFGRSAVPTVMLTGAIGMVLVGALSMEEAVRSIDWKAVFLIAGMLPLGDAMQATGSAELFANYMIDFTGQWGVVAVMISIYFLATLLTSVISNAAAAVLIVPIAINVAQQLGVNPQPFVMTAVVASSSAFLLPIGHQANIIIYGPGNYRFVDFLRVGIWLNLLLMIILAIVIPIVWPF